jgi:hypothetical protein
VDSSHSNTLAEYKALGSPQYPTEDQVLRMNSATALPVPEKQQLKSGKLNLHLEPNSLLLLEVQ